MDEKKVDDLEHPARSHRTPNIDGRPSPEPLDYDKEEWAGEDDGYSGTEAKENDEAGVPDPGPVPIPGHPGFVRGQPEQKVDTGYQITPDLEDIDKDNDED